MGLMHSLRYMPLFFIVFLSCKKPIVPKATTKDVDLGDSATQGKMSGSFSVQVPLNTAKINGTFDYELLMNPDGSATFNSIVVIGQQERNPAGAPLFNPDQGIVLNPSPQPMGMNSPSVTYASNTNRRGQRLTISVEGNTVRSIDYFGFTTTILPPTGLSGLTASGGGQVSNGLGVYPPIPPYNPSSPVPTPSGSSLTTPSTFPNQPPINPNPTPINSGPNMGPFP